MPTVSFDLSPEGALCHGALTWEDNCITAAIDGREIFRSALTDVAELQQRTDVGCGQLELNLAGRGKDENIPVCRFSMSCVDEIGEFCKVVNHYLQTGAAFDIKKQVLRRCEKCGRSLRPGMNTCLFCVDKRGIWLRTFRTLGPLRPALLRSVACMIAVDLSRATVPMLNGWLLDKVLGRDPAQKLAALPFGWAPSRAVWMAGAAMILLFCLGQLFLGLSNIQISRAGVGLADQLRRKTYDKVQNLSLTSMSKRTSGDLMKRVTRDTDTVKGFVNDYGRAMAEKVILIVIIAVVLFVTNPLLALLVLLPVPVTLFVINRFRRRMWLMFEKMWRCSSRETHLLHDIIKGIRVVKTFGTEEREIGKFSTTSARLRDASINVERFWALVNPFTRLAMFAGEVMVIYFGGRMVLKGTMSLGALLQFTLLLSFLYEPLRWMAILPRRLAETTNSLVKIYEIHDEEQTVPAPEQPLTAPITGSLRFENVRFGYVPYEPVLKNVNLEVQPMEMLGLVGPSGAGKSTLINLAMRLYDPDMGRITIGGNDLRDFDPAWLRAHIGVVFQENFLFAGTVYENIAYANPGATADEIIRAAKLANAHEFIMKLPDGYNTLVGEDGHTLSGGERQRIAIARAVLRDPKILILDEATSALDPETEGKVQEALGRLIEGRITIAIAHRLSTLRHADRLAVIDKGSIAELGTHRELLAKKGIYYDLVMTQRQMSKETDGKKDEDDG